MIEKLVQYSSSRDGYNYVMHPTSTDMMDKINEIIDYINDFERGMKEAQDYFRMKNDEE